MEGRYIPLPTNDIKKGMNPVPTHRYGLISKVSIAKPLLSIVMNESINLSDNYVKEGIWMEFGPYQMNTTGIRMSCCVLDLKL